MKKIRNRKYLKAKRRQYSHLLLSFRASIREGAQEMARLDAMIRWLADMCAASAERPDYDAAYYIRKAEKAVGEASDADR